MPPKTSARVVPIGSSIRVVAKRTGINAATLRVWERRYGFPVPERRAGGSRVYTEADVARLELIARALAAGFRPSEVVPVPVPELARLVGAAATRSSTTTNTAVFTPSVVQQQAPVGPSTVAAVIHSLLGDDSREVRALLRSGAVALGPKQFVVALAHPLMVRVGELWEEGALEVRHEHLATACLSTQLRLLLGMLDDGTRGSPSVLLATLPHEPHALALEMVAVYLAASHAEPRMLGADTPPDQIVAAARAFGVDAVGLSIPRGRGAGEVREQVLAISRGLPSRTELWLGGDGALELELGRERVRLARSFADIDDLLRAARGQHLAAGQSS